MHDDIHFLRSARASLLLACTLLCSAAMAGSGAIPTDKDKYPKGVAAAPAVASQCLACHGPTGQSENEEWPNLAGQKQSYLLQQLKDFKSGARKHPMMAPAVAALTDADLKPLADYLSAQAPAQPHLPAGQTAAVAPAAAASCVACHDNAALPTEPFLHAQKATYMAAQLKAFKAGTRKNATMEAMSNMLSEQDIDAISHYFSTLAPLPAVKK